MRRSGNARSRACWRYTENISLGGEGDPRRELRAREDDEGDREGREPEEDASPDPPGPASGSGCSGRLVHAADGSDAPLRRQRGRAPDVRRRHFARGGGGVRGARRWTAGRRRETLAV